MGDRAPTYVEKSYCERSGTITKWALGTLALMLCILITVTCWALQAASTATASTGTLNTSFQSHVAAQQVTEKQTADLLKEIKEDVKELLRHQQPSKP